eukprot:5421527-Pleurochrysis_carterae.AAC.1
MDSTDYKTAWERLHPPEMTIEEHPSPSGSRMVKTYTVRPKVFYGEPHPDEAPPRRPKSFSDPLPYQFALYQLTYLPLHSLPALGSSSATL